MKPRTSEQKRGPAVAACPWQVSVGRQSDGWVFALEPLTQAAIEERHPGSCRVRSVFIGSRSPDDFLDEPSRLPRLLRQVLEILTGLPSDEVSDLGEIRAVDPTDGRTLMTTSSSVSPYAGLRLDPHLPRDPLE